MAEKAGNRLAGNRWHSREAIDSWAASWWRDCGGRDAPRDRLMTVDCSQLERGVSVTDWSIDWPVTEQCILDAASALAWACAIAA